MPALRAPLSGQLTVTSPYGPRADGFHTGVDLAARMGTPVYAAAAGRATRASDVKGGRGIRIDHRDGTSSEYWHLNSQAIAFAGQDVAAGALIGYSGATGVVTGPHLHFETKVNGSTTDPAPALGLPPSGAGPAPSRDLGHVIDYGSGCGPGYVPARLESVDVIPLVLSEKRIAEIGQPGQAGQWDVCLLASRGFQVGQNPYSDVVGGAAHEFGEWFVNEGLPIIVNISIVLAAGMVTWAGIQKVLGVELSGPLGVSVR